MEADKKIEIPLTQGQINYRKRKAREQKKREEQKVIALEKILIDFKTPLKEILLAEIKASNPISGWGYDDPEKGSLFIMLEHAFRTPIVRSSDLFTFENLNDPHYWKAWYLDKINNCYLGCHFDGADYALL